MANVDIRVGKKDAVFFSANPTLILKDGQFLFNSDTLELFIGDGTSQLSALVAINVPPSSGVQSVTGPNVVNTDPLNPVVGTPTLTEAIAEDTTANNLASLKSVNQAATTTVLNTGYYFNFFFPLSGTLLKATILDLRNFLKTYFDTIYTNSAAVATQIAIALSGYLTAATAASTYEPKFSKNTAFNKNFGTGTNNIVEIGATLGNTLPVITDASGKIITSNWVDYSATSTIVGWSSFSIKSIYYIDMGAYYLYKYYLLGTSDAINTTFTMHVNETTIRSESTIRTANNGINGTGLARTTIGSNVVDCFSNITGSNYTASGTKTVSGTFIIMK